MADKVIIDVYAQFQDKMSPNIDNAIKKAEKLERAAKKVANVLDKLDRSNKNADFGIKDKASPVLEKIANKMKKVLGQKKWDFLVSLKDKASAGLDKISNKLKGVLSKKQWDFLVGLKDKASAGLRKISDKLKNINTRKIAIRINVAQNVFKHLGELNAKLNALTSKSWKFLVGLADKATNGLSKIRGVAKALVMAPYKVTVSLVDKVTAPLRKITGALNSVTGMVGVGLSGYGLVVNPVKKYADREDLISQFKVLLGSQKAAEDRISELTSFAGQTPFTRDQIFSASKMLETYTQGALSSPDSVGGIRMVGDIAAATGADYNSVAMYMGRLYNEVGRGGEALGEPLMLLREIGAVSADAEKKIQEIAQGSGTVEEKWAQIAKEFSKFDGMMLEMSNQMNNLLLGVASFVNNNFLMKIGEGISSELKPFLIDFRSWRNENSDLIASWGSKVKSFAALLSGKVLGTLRKISSLSFELFSSEDFKSASLAGKVGMIWNDIIADPLSEWWSGRGKGLFESKAREMGTFLGESLTRGLTAIFSGDFSTALTSLFPTMGAFLQGLFSNLDGKEITEAMRNFVENIPKALENIKMNWNEYIAEPFKAWWQSGGKDMFSEFASNIGDWLGKGITKGVQFLSDGLLTMLGLKDADGIAGEAGAIGKSFWDSFTASFDGSAITKAIVDAISGVWSVLPTWAKFLLGGMAVSKAASFLAPIANLAGGIGNIGKGVAAGFGNTAKGVGTVGAGLGQGASLSYYAGSGLFNLGTKAATVLGGTGALGATGTAVAGLGAIGGGIATGVGIYDAGTDFYSAYKAHKAGDTAEFEKNLVTGTTKAGTMGIGAAIGTAIAPGVGTLIGAGLGYLGGKFFGDKIAKSMEADNWKSEAVKSAIKDTDMTEEEKAYIKQQAIAKDMEARFGSLELSLNEIETISKKLVRGDKAQVFEKIQTAVSGATTSLKNYNAAAANVEKWNWKAGLGIKLTDDEKEEFMASIDELMSNAEQTIEDQHYRFAAGVELFFGEGESEEKTRIINIGNKYFEDMQSELDTLNKELKAEYDVILEDNVITPDEAKTLMELQQKINELTEKLNDGMQTARLEALKIEFGGANMTQESFGNMLAQIQKDIEADLQTRHDEFTYQLGILNVALEEARLAGEDTTEIEKAIADLKEKYAEQITGAFEQPIEFAVQTVADLYSVELGEDGFTKLNTMLAELLNSGKDPMELTLEEMRIKLGVPNLDEESYAGIQQYLQQIYELVPEEHREEIALLLGLNPQTTGDTAAETQAAIDGAVPSDPVEKDKTVTLNPIPKVGDTESFSANAKENILSSLPSGSLLEEPKEVSVPVKPEPKVVDGGEGEDGSSVASEVQSQVKTKLEETIEPVEPEVKVLPNYITGETSETFKVEDHSLDTTAEADVTVNTSYDRTPKDMTVEALTAETTADVTVDTTYTLDPSEPTWPKFTASTTATVTVDTSYTITGGGGKDGNPLTPWANGGIVTGPTPSLIGEAGPEAIIPLSPSRRDRGLALWHKAGKMLGVLENANGGIYDGSSEDITGGSESTTTQSMRAFVGGTEGNSSQEVSISSNDSNKIDVHVGGVTIQVNANDGNIVDAIKANIDEITEEVAGVLQNALAANFKNMPARS